MSAHTSRRCTSGAKVRHPLCAAAITLTCRSLRARSVFNTVPSLGYLCTAVAQLAASLYYGPTTPAKAHRQLLGQLSMANLLFDLLYCVDALLVGWEWFKSETEPPSDDIDGADEHSDTSANEFKALVNATPVDFAPI